MVKRSSAATVTDILDVKRSEVALQKRFPVPKFETGPASKNDSLLCIVYGTVLAWIASHNLEQ